MPKGLHILENNGRLIALDANNVFWALLPKTESRTFIPEEVLLLHNKFKDKFNRDMADFRFSSELTAIYIDPTDKCNANCAYCYVPPETRRNGRSMTAKELKFILDKLAAYFKKSKKKQVVIFHASEPLLEKGLVFEAIVRYGKIFKFGLQTNALLLEKDDVDFLKENSVGVGISLDSNSALINNNQRPSRESGGNFAKAVEAIEWFNGYPGLNVITTVTKHNVKNLPGIIKFLHRRKVPCVLLNPVRFTRVPVKALKPDEKVFAKHFIEAVDTAIELTRKTGRKIIVGNFANTVLAIVAPQARRLMCDISPCGGGRCFFTITASGEMIPCGEFIGLPGFSGGNIFKDNISKVMNSKPFQAIRSRSVEKIKECDVCELRNICGAPCPAELHAHGTMYQKALFCDFYKEVICHAFKIIADDKVKLVLRDEPLKELAYEYKLSF